MKIAIIGVSFRLPSDIDSFDDLYNALSSKKDCVTTHPIDRFNITKYYDSNNNNGKMRTMRGGYVNNIFDFDAEFFNISPKEAKSMDPQQRKMMELIYECIEDSNIPLNNIRNTKTGVFMGSCSTEYFNMESEAPENCNEYFITGGLLTLLSNRISYYFDLKGPSLTLDTACSSSGHALHLACQSIINGESEMCFVGGSNILLSPETFVGFSQATMLSPDGKCMTFDDKANGYVRSEGFISLLLKPLDKAINDKNKIYAVINKTGINQDGKTPSITMPNPKAQMALLEEMYQDINLKDIVYMEAHGTGTQVGDYNETLALGSVIGKNKSKILNIGSIKSNIGHMEAASGLASILKICLMMNKKELLPNLHFNTPNSKIDFNNLNLNVVIEKQPIVQDKIIMGVNNFGFGGSNFHCILENYITEKDNYDSSNMNQYHLLAIHGYNEDSINNNIFEFLSYDSDLFMKYLYNMNYKQSMSQSKVFIIEDMKDFENIIYDSNENSVRNIYASFSKEKLTTAFVFCGQGSQHIRMGYDMCRAFPVFREIILLCDKHWEEISGESFIKKTNLFLQELEMKEPTSKINQPIVAQPAILFYQIALIELYKSYHITPSVVIGHSAGELASFYAAGAITLRDCIEFSYYRSMYQNETVNMGNMIVINKTFEEVKNIAEIELINKLELACINDKNTIVLAGSTQNVKKLKVILDQNDIFNAIIRGNCPFHSSFQDVIKEKILKFTKKVRFSQPKIPLISTTLGCEVNLDNYTNDYWWKNIRNPVLFYDGLKCMNYVDIFVELGPHPVLKNNIVNTYPESYIFSSSNRKKESSIIFMNTLANLWIAGNEINLDNFGIKNNKYFPKHKWNHKKYKNIPLVSFDRHHQIKNDVNIIRFSSKKYSYITDHVIDNKFIFPTVGYIDVIIKNFSNMETIILEDFTLKNMYLPNDIIEFYWTLNCNKLTFKSVDRKNEYMTTSIFNENVRDYSNKLDLKNYQYNFKLSGKECYQMLKLKKFNFGKNMKSINYVLVNEENCIISLNDNFYDTFNPTSLDAGLLSGMIINGITNNFTYLPVYCKRISLNTLDNPKWIYTEIVENNLKFVVINVFFYDKNMKQVGSYYHLKANNVSNFSTTNLFSIVNSNIDIENSKLSDENIVIFSQDIDTTMNDMVIIYHTDNVSLSRLISDIRIIEEIKNIKHLFFILNTNNDGIFLGFLRTYINESKITISIIITDNDINSVRNKIPSLLENGYMSEYMINNDNITAPTLEKLTLKPKSYPNYYVNKNGKGIDNIEFFPILENNGDEYDIIVETKASALNFKDLMVNLNVVSEDYIGYEASGIVVDSRVNDFKIGDEVIVLKNKTGKAISNRIYCMKDECYPKPVSMNHSEACGILIIFCTVYICLIERAKIKKDDTVVIHSATGGIGQAAIMICQMIGAKIIATAGTEEKRTKLKNKFGIDLISDSRNPDIFTQDILEITNQKGVDIVLNSLSGDSLKANFKIIREGGIIVEIGKRDALENNQINLDSFINSITYTSVHFDRLQKSNPEYIKNIIDIVLGLFSENKLKPIEITEYNISDIKPALKFMSKGIHTGKIVIKINDYLPTQFSNPKIIFNSNKFYLISGGLGGLGIELINWMSKHGARKFILTSRSCKISKRANRIISKLEKNNCNIIVAKIDITNYDTTKIYFEENIYDIDGVFHLAGHIEDMMIKDMNDKDISSVLKPKIEGCMVLDKITQHLNLNYFVTFSSISAIIGNPGQSVYAGANCFLDSFCNKRQQLGKPGLSINLGAIGSVGMIHRDYMLAKNMINNGFQFLHYEVLFDNMLTVLPHKNISQVCISNQNWSKICYTFPKTSIIDTFKELKSETKTSVGNNIDESVMMYIKNLLEIESIDMNTSMTRYGIDSLMSLQLSTWFMEEYNIHVTQLEILQGITISEILNKTSNIIQTNETSKSTFKIKSFKKKMSKINIKAVNNDIIIIEENDSTDFVSPIITFMLTFMLTLAVINYLNTKIYFMLYEYIINWVLWLYWN